MHNKYVLSTQECIIFFSLLGSLSTFTEYTVYDTSTVLFTHQFMRLCELTYPRSLYPIQLSRKYPSDTFQKVDTLSPRKSSTSSSRQIPFQDTLRTDKWCSLKQTLALAMLGDSPLYSHSMARIGNDLEDGYSHRQKSQVRSSSVSVSAQPNDSYTHTHTI